MINKLHLAVVGCGDIASYVALVSRYIPNIRITACVSKSKPEAEQFAKKHRIPHVFTNYEQLLQHSDLFDAVYLSTPHHLHAPMIRSAVDQFLPVLCEKPITESVPTAKEIINYVNNSPVKVGINYQYRYNPACQKLIEYTHSDIGKLYYIQINLPWHRELDYFNNSTWHKKKSSAGGGTLLTQGSHYLDIALLAAQSEPLTVLGVTDRKVFTAPDIEIEDYAHGIITLKNKAHIEITSSMVANPQQTATIEIYGEKGYAKFSEASRPHFLTKGISPSRYKQQLPFGVHPLARSLLGFCKWIQQDQPYLTPIHSALPVMAAVDAIYRSAALKKEIQL